MPTLLCTLGTSWAVVPEAFLLGNGGGHYDHVCVLTTSDPKAKAALAKVTDWFLHHHPLTRLTGLAIDSLTDIACAGDHQRFEEALYRAYFALVGEGLEMHVCLAGGFKTMSAAAQEAAGLLGCGKLFHILAHSIETIKEDGTPGLKLPDTWEEVRDALDEGRVKLVDLGCRSGWPTIRELAEMAPPLPPPGEPFLVEDHTLGNAVHQRVEAANRLAASEKELATLPFPQLARWAPGERAALAEPLDAAPGGSDHAWLLALPKVDLHCHLGGFATHGELLQEVRGAATYPELLQSQDEPPLPESWPQPVHPVGLECYRKLGDATGSALLRDPGCLQRHIRLLYAHFQQQNLIHAEVRCSPANYASHGRSAWNVLEEILGHFARCEAEAKSAGRPAPRVNLLIIATRQSGGDFRTQISRHLALAATAFEHWTDDALPRVVGVDLAGYEDKETRAHYFRDDFMAALRLGMGITVHAGENDDAEGIWSAILDLNARRLGHALHLAASPSLLRTVSDRRIGIEMCPYANFQIVSNGDGDASGFPLDAEVAGHPHAYPLRGYLEAGVPVTVNTDNIGISAASLTDNFLLLARLCPGITRLEVLRLIRHAIDQAFLPDSERSALLARLRIPLPR